MDGFQDPELALCTLVGQQVERLRVRLAELATGSSPQIR